MRKNAASQVVQALILDINGDPVTAGTTTVYVTGDGGTQSTGGGTNAHEGNGVWTYNCQTADTNYNHVSFLFTNSSTDAVSTLIQVWPIAWSNGYPSIDAQSWKSTTIATPSITGVPEVDVTHGKGVSLATPTVGGYVKTDVTLYLASAAQGSGGRPEVLLSATAKNDVNAEVLDVLDTDAFAELGAVPAANAPLSDKINWLFALARNKVTQTATTQTLRNDADSGDIATAGVSDDGTTFTRDEFT